MQKDEHFLVVRNDRLGDAILALPVVASLKAARPESKVTFLASSYTAPLIKCVEGIDIVIAAPDNHCQIVLNELQSHNFSTAICLRPTFSNALTLARIGIPTQIGTSRRLYSFLFTDRVSLIRSGSAEHEADLNLQLLKPLQITPKTDWPEINLPAKALVDANFLLGANGEEMRLAVIHPGSGGSARNWPFDCYQELAKRLADFNMKVVITGSISEHELCSRVTSQGMINLAGKTDLVTLAAVIRRAAILIAGSTGPLHLAVALGIPVVGLYPPTKDNMPSRWGPYRHPEWAITPDLPMCKACRPGQRSNCRCMEQIAVETVLTKALQVMSGHVH